MLVRPPRTRLYPLRTFAPSTLMRTPVAAAAPACCCRCACARFDPIPPARAFVLDPIPLIRIGRVYTHPSSILLLVRVCPPLGLCVPASLLSEHHYLL